MSTTLSPLSLPSSTVMLYACQTPSRIDRLARSTFSANFARCPSSSRKTSSSLWMSSQESSFRASSFSLAAEWATHQTMAVLYVREDLPYLSACPTDGYTFRNCHSRSYRFG